MPFKKETKGFRTLHLMLYDLEITLCSMLYPAPLVFAFAIMRFCFLCRTRTPFKYFIADKRGMIYSNTGGGLWLLQKLPFLWMREQ